MTIYTLFNSFCGETSYFGAFSSKENAESAMELLKDKFSKYHSFWIEETILDELIDEY